MVCFNNFPYEKKYGGKSLKYRLFRSYVMGLDYIFPPECLGCGKLGEHWCANCQASITPIQTAHCKICFLEIERMGVCSRCRKDRPFFDAARALGKYEGPLAKAIVALKYRKDYALGIAFVASLAVLIEREGWSPDGILAMPLAKGRMQERGYNQVEIFTLALSLYLDLAHGVHWMRRSKETRSQVGLSYEERIDNLKDAFQGEPEILAGKSILLMDDVMTTGASMNAATKALKLAGATSVFALCLARASEVSRDDSY